MSEQTQQDQMVEPDWLDGDCPGGLSWSGCIADDCGVSSDGVGCQFAAYPGTESQ